MFTSVDRKARSHKARAFSILLSLLVAACATLPEDAPPFRLEEPSADTGTVYIYWPERRFNSAGFPDLLLNGEKRLTLLEKGYGVFRLRPGRYEIKVEGSALGNNWYPQPAVATLDVKAGHEYFVRVVPVRPTAKYSAALAEGIHYAQHSRALIELVPKQDALEEISVARRLTQ